MSLGKSNFIMGADESERRPIHAPGETNGGSISGALTADRSGVAENRPLLRRDVPRPKLPLLLLLAAALLLLLLKNAPTGRRASDDDAARRSAAASDVDMAAPRL